MRMGRRFAGVARSGVLKEHLAGYWLPDREISHEVRFVILSVTAVERQGSGPRAKGSARLTSKYPISALWREVRAGDGLKTCLGHLDCLRKSTLLPT